jgi:hypothetical protein
VENGNGGDGVGMGMAVCSLIDVKALTHDACFLISVFCLCFLFRLTFCIYF